MVHKLNNFVFIRNIQHCNLVKISLVYPPSLKGYPGQSQLRAKGTMSHSMERSPGATRRRFPGGEDADGIIVLDVIYLVLSGKCDTLRKAGHTRLVSLSTCPIHQKQSN
jgi:hypothetical protein